ncbi:unnamed protein product [Sphacelaria rigidula]
MSRHTRIVGTSAILATPPLSSPAIPPLARLVIRSVLCSTAVAPTTVTVTVTTTAIGNTAMVLHHDLQGKLTASTVRVRFFLQADTVSSKSSPKVFIIHIEVAIALRITPIIAAAAAVVVSGRLSFDHRPLSPGTYGPTAEVPGRKINLHFALSGPEGKRRAVVERHKRQFLGAIPRDEILRRRCEWESSCSRSMVAGAQL